MKGRGEELISKDLCLMFEHICCIVSSRTNVMKIHILDLLRMWDLDGELSVLDSIPNIRCSRWVIVGEKLAQSLCGTDSHRMIPYRKSVYEQYGPVQTSTVPQKFPTLVLCTVPYRSILKTVFFNGTGIPVSRTSSHLNATKIFYYFTIRYDWIVSVP